MPQAVSIITRYFAVDADHDISADTLTLSLDRKTWTPAQYVAQPSARLQTATPPPQTGLTRYWWSLLCGSGQPIAPSVGLDIVYGQLVDGVQDLLLSWNITTQY